MATAMKIAPIEPSIFDDDDDGWQDMPIVRDDDIANALDEEDQKKYHYKPPEKKAAAPLPYASTQGKESHRVRRSTSRSSVQTANTGSSLDSQGSSGLRRKPIPVELFVRC